VTPAGVVVPEGSRFHHVGVACRELDGELAGMRALAYEPVGAPFVDPQQGITGVFVEGLGPRLELLAPLEGSAVLDPWLRGGSRMYHLAYEVADLDAAVTSAEAEGARLVSEPVPSVAFDQRRICFLMLRVRLLTELIELAR
jgi:methylmalonyl-CoA/ethylmalonyl-CoA epimerase